MSEKILLNIMAFGCDKEGSFIELRSSRIYGVSPEFRDYIYRNPYVYLSIDPLILTDERDQIKKDIENRINLLNNIKKILEKEL